MADRIEEIVSLIFATRRMMHEQKEQKQNSCSHLQLMTLVYIKENSPLMKNIAEFLNITPPSATSLINSLIKSELVERKEDETDRRIVRIAITKKGKKYLQMHKKVATERMRTILKKLNEKEQKDLINILQKIINC